MSLYKALQSISQQVEIQLPQMKNNETATKHVSILPFVRALGYNTQDLSEVYPEYPILNMDAVDLAILRDGEPIMFLEAKKAGEGLGDKHWKQLFEYFNADKARIGILTNGLEFRWYTDIEKPNIMDKDPFLTINLRDLDKPSVAHLIGFTKTHFDHEQSLRKIKISNLLARELRRPSDEFVRYFAKQIHSGSVWQNVIDEFRPVLKECFEDLVATGNERSEPTLDEQTNLVSLTEPDAATDQLPKNPDSDAVLELPVQATYRGNTLSATLLVVVRLVENSKIRFKESDYWVSRGALIAIQTINPTLNNPPNGWKFWKLRDPNGNQERPISDLRSDDALLRRLQGKTS